jgi:hypothetical protein
MPSCSKAPRGLSVLVRVNGIFTAIAISPSPSLRQCPYRYAIRAGRNLPDKEFRYLRTVIVTAAVYWGFISQLAPLHLTFQHRAGVSPYTSTFVLAQTCVFDKQSHGLFRCGPRVPRSAESWRQQELYLKMVLKFHQLCSRCNTRSTIRGTQGQTLSRSYGRCIAEFLNEGSLVRLGLLDLNT